MKKRFNWVSLVVMLIIVFLSYYLFLPVINISDPTFWVYVFVMLIIWSLLDLFNNIDMKTGLISNRSFFKGRKYIYGLLGIILLVIIIINVVLSPLFSSSSYAKRITINEDSSFSEDVAEVDFSKVPLLDKKSSTKLGDRVMGEMTDLVSQFYVSDLYTQINYKNEVVRVTPLEYSGLIKYFTNRSGGVKGYIIVNSTTGKTNLVKLDKGMKYMPSAMFNENLDRKLRFSYPTTIFGQANFELDEDGNPYWVVPTVKYSGVGLKREVTGVVILNPINGESKKYSLDKIPSWVDHVHEASLILEQVDDWGSYRKGFINSILGQKSVVMTTDGYNYLAMDDDIYLYTGITSVASDESNLGFILSNMRTKETVYYKVPGAEEYSAMDSAEGQVQDLKYKATFPLLINLNNKPTYLISLKDNAGLVKKYAFVDVQDYQKVTVTDSSKGIEVAAKNYLASEGNKNTGNLAEKEITISQITSAIIDGNTHYYIVDSEGKRYKLSIKVDEDYIPFLASGNKIKINYIDSADTIEIIKIVR